MPVKRRIEKRRATVSPTAWKILNDQPLTDEDSIEAFVLDPYRPFHIGVGPDVKDLWAEHRDEILADWIAEAPGSRPTCWWCFDAPREPVMVGPGPLRPAHDTYPRRERLGGVGTAPHEAYNLKPSFRIGIPLGSWVKADETRQYGGVDFTYFAIDPRNPPRFESEAGYLLRHDLLLPGERRRLTAEDFEPEAVGAPEPTEI